MKILSSIEIRYIVQEIQFLLDSKVDQIYQPNTEELILALHKTNHGKKLLRLVPGTCLYLASKKSPSPTEQLNFCKYLRKRLLNSRLKSIEQKNMERIVELHFESKDSKFILITEFFSKGNIIFCDSEYNILSALQFQSWKDRTIKTKVKYEYPPAKKLNYSLEDFKNLIATSNKESIVKTLAMSLNLGGLYAEELCLRSRIDKTQKTLSESETKIVYKELQKLLTEKSEPNLLPENPVPIKLSSGEGKKFPTYNEALDSYYSQFIQNSEEEIKEDPKLKKYQEILKDQESQYKDIELSIQENRFKGEYIYNNYMELQELIENFRNKKPFPKTIKIENKTLILEIK
jgi:predicted ribosome quality control (RQC) complex YloA/Tae2 family protein